MKIKSLFYILMGILFLWIIWASHWSEGVKSCHARGGTNFDPIGWDCLQIKHLN